MSEIVGHDKVIERLNLGIPPVSIFRGEASVGKWTTALWVRDHLGVVAGDAMELKFLTMERVRQSIKFLKRAPHGQQRLLIAFLGGASWSIQAGLLLALENLPPTSLVILVAPPDTLSPALQSRGEIFDFSVLSTDSVAEILMGRNFGEGKARNLAELSGGHVATALRFLEANETKIAVLGAVRALLIRDAKALDTFAGRWSDEHTELLAAMCREAISGRHTLFTDEETEAFGRKLALKVLMTIRTEVRPRLVVHSQLMTVLKGE